MLQREQKPGITPGSCFYYFKQGRGYAMLAVCSLRVYVWLSAEHDNSKICVSVIHSAPFDNICVSE